MNIEFWFDYASTYSYPAAMRIEAIAASHNIKVLWRPFVLGAIFKQQGINDSPFNIYPAKGEYMWRDMARVCDDLAIPFKRPQHFPQNGLLAARITQCFSDELWVGDFVRAIYIANFGKGLDISDAMIVRDCLSDLGVDTAVVMDKATSQAAKQMLRKQTDEAMARGIFGAPSFYVEDELFWGNDRLERAIQWSIERKV